MSDSRSETTRIATRGHVYLGHRVTSARVSGRLASSIVPWQPPTCMCVFSFLFHAAVDVCCEVFLDGKIAIAIGCHETFEHEMPSLVFVGRNTSTI